MTTAFTKALRPVQMITFSVLRLLGSTPSQRFIAYLLFAILSFVAVYPILWVVINSLKTDVDLFRATWELPKNPLWQNYSRAWEFGIARYILNSVLVTSVSVFLTVTISLMGAYSLARFEFRFKTFSFIFVLGGLMLSPQVALIPLFRILVALGIYNTYLAMILPYVAFGIPFTTFLLRAYILSLPRELEEAALIDGAGYVGVFRYVIVPLSRPIIASAALLEAMRVWNEFMFGLTFIESNHLKTLPVGIASFSSALRTEYTVIMSGLVIAAIPMIALFLVSQRQFIRGLTAGGIKG